MLAAGGKIYVEDEFSKAEFGLIYCTYEVRMETLYY